MKNIFWPFVPENSSGTGEKMNRQLNPDKPRSFTEKVIMNYMHQSLPAKPCQNMISNPIEMYLRPKYVTQQNVLQQKLMCSQLIHFLRTSARVEQPPSSGPDVKYRADTADGSLTSMQHQNTAPIEGHEVIASARGKKDIKNDQICCEVSETFFAVKDRSTDRVAYRWMVTSSSKLWDIGDVFTGMNQSLPEPLPNKVKDFLFQDDWKVPNAFSQSICPSGEESTQIDDVKDGDGETIRIPEFQIHKFEEMPVVTTQIVNPNKFFIQHKDTHFVNCLNPAVRPVNGELWSVEAISWFKSKVQNKTLYARLHPQAAEVSMELFMEKGKIGAMRRGDSLLVRLVQHGFAQYELQKPKRLRTSHVQLQTILQSLEWEKYLISCYCHNRKRNHSCSQQSPDMHSYARL